MTRAALCCAIFMVAAPAVADVVPPQGDPPLMMIRLRGPHTADDAQWAKTFKILRENRGDAPSRRAPRCGRSDMVGASLKDRLVAAGAQGRRDAR